MPDVRAQPSKGTWKNHWSESQLEGGRNKSRTRSYPCQRRRSSSGVTPDPAEEETGRCVPKLEITPAPKAPGSVTVQGFQSGSKSGSKGFVRPLGSLHHPVPSLYLFLVRCASQSLTVRQSVPWLAHAREPTFKSLPVIRRLFSASVMRNNACCGRCRCYPRARGRSRANRVDSAIAGGGTLCTKLHRTWIQTGAGDDDVRRSVPIAIAILWFIATSSDSKRA